MSYSDEKITFTFKVNKFSKFKSFFTRKKPQISTSKKVLSKNCEYFNSQFSGRWKQANIYKVEGFSWDYYKAFKSIIKFIETRSIGEISPQVALDIAPASLYYQLEHSKEFDRQVYEKLSESVGNEEVKEYIRYHFPENHIWILFLERGPYRKIVKSRRPTRMKTVKSRRPTRKKTVK